MTFYKHARLSVLLLRLLLRGAPVSEINPPQKQDDRSTASSGVRKTELAQRRAGILPKKQIPLFRGLSRNVFCIPSRLSAEATRIATT